MDTKHGFAPAAITFYSVLYRLRKEGLVRKVSDMFRSSYEVTAKGEQELQKALALLQEARMNLSASREPVRP